MSSEYAYSSSIKIDGSKNNYKRLKSSKFALNNSFLCNSKKTIDDKFSDMKSIDITSRLGQFAWRQIVPSTIFLPVLFRHHHREEYVCVQMLKVHILSIIPSEIISYWMIKYPLSQYSLTVYEGELLHHINVFHSNRILSKSYQLNYSQLDCISLTPLTSFLKFYQLICSTSRLTNPFGISSPVYHKSITDKEKAVSNTMYDSSKSLLTKKTESNTSFCREIIFHGKEILSYCTTSSMNINDKDSQTISCLSIKDIVTIYFPWSSIEQFIQICRKKQITRFKPDKSTDYDASLRLVNMQELEQHWSFILKELLPNQQIANHQSINQCENEKSLSMETPSPDILIPTVPNEIILSNVTNEESITEPVEYPLKENVIDDCIINDNQCLHLSDNSPNQLDDSSPTIPKEDQLEIVSLENNPKEELSIIINENELLTKPNLKRKQSHHRRRRRRQRLTLYSSKRRRKENDKRISNDEFWLKKYSIEPFTIVINRYEIPLD